MNYPNQIIKLIGTNDSETAQEEFAECDVKDKNSAWLESQIKRLDSGNGLIITIMSWHPDKRFKSGCRYQRDLSIRVR